MPLAVLRRVNVRRHRCTGRQDSAQDEVSEPLAKVAVGPHVPPHAVIAERVGADVPFLWLIPRNRLVSDTQLRPFGNRLQQKCEGLRFDRSTGKGYRGHGRPKRQERLVAGQDLPFQGQQVRQVLARTAGLVVRGIRWRSDVRAGPGVVLQVAWRYFGVARDVGGRLGHRDLEKVHYVPAIDAPIPLKAKVDELQSALLAPLDGTGVDGPVLGGVIAGLQGGSRRGW